MVNTIICAELNNGMLMPAVGLGTWQLEGKDPNTTTIATECLKLGYFLIDTANAYQNQPALGKGIAAFKPADRESLREVDLTGVSTFRGVDQSTFLANLKKPHADRECFVTGKVFPVGYTPEKLRLQVDNYLTEIGRKSADLILMHWPSQMTAWATEAEMKDPKNPETRLTVWHTLEEMVAEGKIRAIGVSNFMTKHLEPLIEDILARKAKGCTKATLPVTNQIELNPFCLPTPCLVDLCKKHSIVFTSYSTLGSTKASVRNDPKILELAKKVGRTPTQLVLRWALQKGYMVIPRTGKADHARENLEIQYFSLTQDQMKLVDDLYSGADVRGCPDPNMAA